mgnify:CR=1 FL=1
MKSQKKYPCKNAYTKIYESQLNEDCWAEYPFHPTRRFRFDYAFPRVKIAIEVDGGLFNSYQGKHAGRHSGGIGQKNDMEKCNEAAAMGIRVLHFIPDEMFCVENIKIIRREMEENP